MCRMMKKYYLPIFLLLCLNVFPNPTIFSPEIWHRPDSLLALPKEDSIVYSPEYTIFVVVRSIHRDSAECLWSFTENDTVSTAVLTRGIYLPTTGILLSNNPQDFSHWCIYTYHSGIHADSTKQRELRLGGQRVYPRGGTPIDSLHARIEMEEIAYLSGNVSRHLSSTFQTYLALKYGITLDYAAYLSQSGDTLWHPKNDEDYYHRIIGIGNNTAYEWTANVSKSKENAVLSIRTDTLMPDEYILLGDDDGTLEWHPEADGSYSMQRTWRIRQFVNHPKHIVLTMQSSSNGDVSDALWLNVSDINGHVLQTIRPDSVIGDSISYFSLNRPDTLMHLHFGGMISSEQRIKRIDRYGRSTGNGSESNIQVDFNNMTIAVNGYPAEQVFVLYLYDNTGKYLSTVTSRNPIDIRTLPNSVFYIEITADSNIVGAVNIPVNLY